MAPRQLLLELEEVDMAADKGPKRVRVDRADESSTQMVSSSFDPFLPTAAELAGDAPADEPQNEQPSERQDEKPGQEPTADFKEALGRFDQSQHYLLIFTQVTNGQPFVRIDTSKANWEVFSNAAQAGLEPINPMCISSPPTGPLHFAVTEQYAKDYIMLYPSGIDVPSPSEGQPPVHFAVSYRQANKPNPTKRRVAANILARIAITVQHFELRNLAQFIRPSDLAAGWAALGFDPINPRWGQNKITNQEGEKALGGRNSVIWIDLIPPEGLNILGAPFPIVIKGRYHNGSTTPTFGYFPYAIQPHNDLLDPKGNSYLCLRSNGCHRYLRTAERLLTAAVEAKVASSRTIINFCELGGNHSDPNPHNRGNGKGKHARHSGRGRGGIAEFYNRSSDTTECFFFQKGKCIHNKAGGNCKKEHKGVPQTITCTLPTEGLYCRNGKGCLYHHLPKGAGPSSSNQEEGPFIPESYNL